MQDAADTAEALRMCLYGSPLEAGERPSDRLVAIDLCKPTAARPAAWPACHEPLRAFIQAANVLESELGDPRLTEARVAAQVVLDWDEPAPPWLIGTTFEERQIETLERVIQDAGLPSPSIAPIDPICVERPLFKATDVEPLGTIDTYVANVERTPGRALRAVWTGGAGAPSRACWFSPDDEPIARCGSPDVENIAMPLSADDAIHDVLIWDSPVQGEKPDRIVDARGSVLVEMDFIREHGWARADGGIDVLDFDGALWRVTAGGTAAMDDSSAGPNATPYAAVRPGWLLRETRSDPADRSFPPMVRIEALRAGADGAPVGQPVQLGEMKSPGLLRSCRTPEGGLVLAFVGRPGELVHDEGTTLHRHHVSVWFPVGNDRFTDVSGDVDLPAAPATFGDEDGVTTFGCAPDGSPRWLWSRGAEIRELVCQRSGCRQRSSGPLTFEVDELERLAYAPLGIEDVLMVYMGIRNGATDRLLHNTRVRIAPIGELVTKSDRVLMTNDRHGGLEALWEGVFAFGRGEVGWVGLRANGQLYVFRTTAQKDIVPVRLAR
jgi:hypothetical protein